MLTFQATRDHEHLPSNMARDGLRRYDGDLARDIARNRDLFQGVGGDGDVVSGRGPQHWKGLLVVSRAMRRQCYLNDSRAGYYVSRFLSLSNHACHCVDALFCLVSRVHTPISMYSFNLGTSRDNLPATRPKELRVGWA